MGSVWIAKKPSVCLSLGLSLSLSLTKLDDLKEGEKCPKVVHKTCRSMAHIQVREQIERSGTKVQAQNWDSTAYHDTLQYHQTTGEPPNQCLGEHNEKGSTTEQTVKSSAHH